MLMNMKELLSVANEHNFAVPAFNIGTGQILNAVVECCEEKQAPVILAIHPNELEFQGDSFIEMCKDRANKSHVPMCIHLDHGATMEQVQRAIRCGFTSVMIDASHHAFDENIEITRKVVDYAHERGVVVEAELVQLAGVEDDVKVAAEDASYTHPDEVEEFVDRTGVDSLAIAIGTSHGAFKFKPGQKPMLRFDILDEVSKRLPNFPIVLHGASSVSQEYVKIIQANGGNLADAIGIPEDMLRQAARSAVCKINIDSDLRLALTAGVREVMWNHPEKFDPREYLKVGRQYVKDVVAHKITTVLGSEGKAPECL